MFFGGCSFALGGVGYFTLRMIMPHGWVFGALYRMFLYHWAHPLQYIGLVSLIYAAVATSVVFLCGNLTGRWPHLMIPFIMLTSILAASPAGGVLWVIHDMQAGYFPEGSRFWNDIAWGAITGASTGWVVVLLSVPYNIFGLVAGYYVTLLGYRMTLQKNTIRQPVETSRTLAQLNVRLARKTSSGAPL
ncbi:hypothetical protein JIN84_20825 [Luteolibacter yonseiensis]|uniref:Uncharacterized protein n=1 Tax=Luteolibacter yonseiensis TaxID=1144680 RepID=A0A934VDZ5_9BACT|nr:hypothetical protein [Luteolibacter yonseiensis]MBK1818079.1 hypothetical protein [Luteolibacter yonseiensis]